MDEGTMGFLIGGGVALFIAPFALRTFWTDYWKPWVEQRREVESSPEEDRKT